MELVANPRAARFYEDARFVSVGAVETSFGDATLMRLVLQR